MANKPVEQVPQFTFRTVRQFVAAFQSAHWPSGIFYRTYRRFRIGRPATVKVSLGRGKPPMVLAGTICHRRRGRRQPRVAGGVGIDLHASEAPRIEYLLQLARSTQSAADAGNRRRHHRLPLDLPVSWQRSWSPPAPARLGDIGFGGAFVKDVDSLPIGDILLGISLPGAAAPTVVGARVAWVRHEGEPGFGVKWRARDTGGLRLIRELVTRIKMPRPE